MYAKLYPQNGDRIVAIDSVTSLHPVCRPTADIKLKQQTLSWWQKCVSLIKAIIVNAFKQLLNRRDREKLFTGIPWNNNKSQHTHTHTTFNGPFSGSIQVSRYQKVKTNLDFTEARDSEWQWHQLGHMQVCTLLQTDNHASTPPLLSFLQAGCPSCRPTNSVKALKAKQVTTAHTLFVSYKNQHMLE